MIALRLLMIFLMLPLSSTLSAQEANRSRFGFEYLRPKSGGFAQLRIRKEDVILADLVDQLGVFERSRRENISKDGRFIMLNELERGLASTVNDSSSHERAYCVFVSLSDGCVLDRRTGDICGGEWDASGKWVDAHGQSINFEESRITAKSLVSEKGRRDWSLVYNAANLLRCDPLRSANAIAHAQLIKLKLLE